VPEEIACALTWGADEKVLLILAAVGWLASRGRSEALRRAGNHALLVAGAASLLPHGLKLLPNPSGSQDRAGPHPWHLVLRQTRGRVSLRPRDAHGALASAAAALPAGPRRAIQALTVGLSLTRVVLLVHWASDVVVWFALGGVLERIVRLWTGYPVEPSQQQDRGPARKEAIYGTGRGPLSKLRKIAR
jgi:hypothetical protein